MLRRLIAQIYLLYLNIFIVWWKLATVTVFSEKNIYGLNKLNNRASKYSEDYSSNRLLVFTDWSTPANKFIHYVKKQEHDSGSALKTFSNNVFSLLSCVICIYMQCACYLQDTNSNDVDVYWHLGTSQPSHPSTICRDTFMQAWRPYWIKLKNHFTCIDTLQSANTGWFDQIQATITCQNLCLQVFKLAFSPFVGPLLHRPGSHIRWNRKIISCVSTPY